MLHRNISNLWRESKRGLETTFSEKLAKRLVKNPSSVIKELIPNNNPKGIRLLRQSLIEPISGQPSAEGKVLWNQIRQAWLANAVDEATKTGVAKPAVFDGILRKLTPAGARELFPEREVTTGLKKIQTLFQTAGRTVPSGTSLFSRGAQITGLALMYKGAKDGDFVGFTAGGVLAIGPLAFAKLATTPRGVKFLTAGFKLKPGATGLVPNAVRMIRLLRDINRNEIKTILEGRKRKARKARAARRPRIQRTGRFGLPTLESL